VIEEIKRSRRREKEVKKTIEGNEESRAN